MTPSQFRRLALACSEAIESSHQSHPDFRVRNKIFASLGYPDANWGMLRLTPDQQAEVMAARSTVFHPAAGAWGRSGSTIVLLSAIKPAELRPIIRQAYENIVAK